jgi:hypothetical protein
MLKGDLMKGSCHCGEIRFEVEGAVKQVLSCNCSICSRKGALLWFVARSQLRLSTPAENLSTYTFNKHAIKHRFCQKCGIHTFGEAKDPSGNEMAAINARCLEDVDLSSLKVTHFDGRSR